MLIQKRSATKDMDPNCWTISVGGHMHEGDTPITAAVREAKEEIGLEIDAEQLHLLGEVLKQGTRETEYWYGFRYDLLEDAVLTGHPDEVAELRFVSLEELRKMIHDPAIAWAEDPKKLITDFMLTTGTTSPSALPLGTQSAPSGGAEPGGTVRLKHDDYARQSREIRPVVPPGLGNEIPQEGVSR